MTCRPSARLVQATLVFGASAVLVQDVLPPAVTADDA